MTAATYSPTTPLQGKRIWHGDVIDQLLLAWPTAAVATGAVLLWIFQLAVGAAITFGLLAGCVVALAWTFATTPFARLRDGLTTYEVGKDRAAHTHEYHLAAIGIGRGTQIELIASPAPEPRMPVLMSREETMYWIAAFHH